MVLALLLLAPSFVYAEDDARAKAYAMAVAEREKSMMQALILQGRIIGTLYVKQGEEDPNLPKAEAKMAEHLKVIGYEDELNGLLPSDSSEELLALNRLFIGSVAALRAGQDILETPSEGPDRVKKAENYWQYARYYFAEFSDSLEKLSGVPKPE